LDEPDEFDRYHRGSPIRSGGMSKAQSYLWNQDDPFVLHSVPGLFNVVPNLYWLIHPLRYRAGKSLRDEMIRDDR
jgi:hypothetical protein